MPTVPRFSCAPSSETRFLVTVSDVLLVAILVFLTQFLNWAIMRAIPRAMSNVLELSSGEVQMTQTRLVAAWAPHLEPWWVRGAVLVLEALAVWQLLTKRDPKWVIVLIALAVVLLTMAFAAMFAPLDIVEVVH